ncbi:ABC transporter substrate-binding protein [Tenggerimyces flavus]|uniref:ABC transporter substrate-binding protein n=1 Tax=Tenggerimyces flavus TaxID=1708749 RepID=A0ABV7Y7G4_9ACTN|nr:sugar ABC transporter substrate-binding protein [Tenggerimyces flavus]MBM7785152.1 multiple sugar transport system substrate-binding protein [Tenggerimyces flavus]
MVNRRDLLRLGGLAALGATAAPLLSACSGGGGGSGGGTELQFMYWGSTFEQKAINAMLDKFEEANEGSTVRPLYTPEEYDTKMNTLVASNRPPDVAYMGSAIGYRLADQGKLVNLFDHFDKYPGLAERLPGTYFWYGKDKTFGTQTANEVMLLWYNKKSLDDAGVEHPPASADKAWTWDQLVENAHKLTVDQKGKHPDESGFDPKQIKQFGVSVNIEFPGMWYGLLRSNGVDVVDEAGKKCLLDTPEAIEVFQNLQDLIYKYHVAPTPAQTGGDSAPPSNVQLQTRRIAMVFDGQWILLDMSQSDLDYGIGVLPTYDEPMTASMGGASVIFSDSKFPEEAVELFMFHNDPAHVDLYSNGLWMPLERKYYTEPEFIAKWAENDVHPPEFKTAVIDYTVDNSAAVFSQRLKNMDKIDTILTPALQQIQTGKRPAADVLKELTPKIDKLLLGWNPTQEL